MSENIKTASFIKSHPLYVVNDNSYYRAMLHVGDIRKVKAQVGETSLFAEVEVEPRDYHTKSHAGIFVRYQNMNVKRGKILNIGHTSEELSSDTILLEIRTQLLDLATLEECKVVK